MCLSNFYALVLGLYLFFASLSGLIHTQRLKKIIQEVNGNNALLLLCGLFGIVFGLILVVSHNVWVANWPVVVTLVGWILLLQSLVRIFLPEHFARWMKDFLASSAFPLAIWAWLLVGVYLIWMGFSM